VSATLCNPRLLRQDTGCVPSDNHLFHVRPPLDGRDFMQVREHNTRLPRSPTALPCNGVDERLGTPSESWRRSLILFLFRQFGPQLSMAADSPHKIPPPDRAASLNLWIRAAGWSWCKCPLGMQCDAVVTCRAVFTACAWFPPICGCSSDLFRA
jgi:hypothetical protein